MTSCTGHCIRRWAKSGAVSEQVGDDAIAPVPKRREMGGKPSRDRRFAVADTAAGPARSRAEPASVRHYTDLPQEAQIP